jgi:signal transduction histidine kinase
MEATTARPPLARPLSGATLLLLAALVVINAFAVWEIVAARRNARRLAENELALQTMAHGRSMEAILATMRGDFIFLTDSPPLARLTAALDSADPMVRRWGRLDAEGSLLLFLDAHPAVERLSLQASSGDTLLTAGRAEGAPVMLPGHSTGTGSEWRESLVTSRWPVPDGSQLLAWLDPDDLLAVAAPGLEGRVRLDREASAPVPATAAEAMTARVEVHDARWNPPIRWALVRQEDESQLLLTVETLAGSYRTTVLLDLAVMTFTVVLGLVAFRQARRTARLEAEYEHQARVRELERQLMHSERLASVGRLAAGIAHEINNPLEGMANYLTLMESDLSSDRPERVRKSVGKVREGIERVAGITRQVLAFSDPGRAPKQVLDLRDSLRETVDFVESNPAFREIALRHEPIDEPLPVRGNAVTLGQLFLNLLVNAREAQAEVGGKGEVVVRQSRRDGEALVLVADRGPGIPTEAVDHLFEPFFSTRGSTGLGLAVCHGIVTDHGGTLTVRNREGGGAEVEVRLPLARSEAPETAADDHTPQRAAR